MCICVYDFLLFVERMTPNIQTNDILNEFIPYPFTYSNLEYCAIEGYSLPMLALDWNQLSLEEVHDLLYLSCKNGHKHIINIIIEKSPYELNLNMGIHGAYDGRRYVIIKWLIKRSTKRWRRDTYTEYIDVLTDNKFGELIRPYSQFKALTI